MKKFWFVIAIIMMMTIFTVGCTGRNTESAAQDINPKAEAASKDTKDVTLYFSYNGEYMLAGETRTIDVPVNETLETAVVQALIDGPSADRDELVGLFWDDVELVNTETNGNILLVTLNEAFASGVPDGDIILEDTDAAQQKKLAIKAIVNTIVEMGTYSRVQIYVDRENGTGRITKAEAGWVDEGGGLLDPQGRDAELILTPENTLYKALDLYGKKDWAALYDFTAATSPDGAQKPDIDEFSEALDNADNVLQSFFVNGLSVFYDGQTAVVMLDYTIKTREGHTVKDTNVPILLVREKDIWKVSYHALLGVLLNE